MGRYFHNGVEQPPLSPEEIVAIINRAERLPPSASPPSVRREIDERTRAEPREILETFGGGARTEPGEGDGENDAGNRTA